MYQVALTVERWLVLSDDDVLELEAGEDIDLCIGGLTFDDADQERVLEQIKHREGSITLRTDEARAFLANAYEHQNNNPSRRLVSRLISTASAGQETPTPLSPRAPALERWAKINAKADPVADKAAIEAIISLLREATKQPRNFNELTWSIFASFVRTAQAPEFARFMAQVEWALGADEHDDVEARTKTRLVSDGWCSSAETATSAFQHLFCHVFHLLAKRETKSLTRASLQSTLEKQERTEADAKVWKRVSDLVAEHDVRISILETEAAATRATIASLARSQNIASDLVLVNQRRSFSPPPVVADYVDRAELNAQLVAKFTSSHIVHIFGESGIGKTQLVRAVASSTTASWVRLRRQTGHEVLDAIAAGKEHALSNDHKLLILDDMGRIADSDPVAESIAELINEAIVTVSTSLFDMPARLRSDLGSACETISVPPWDTLETRTLLTLLSAPQPLLADTTIEVFLAVTRGHPSLLRALATYLRQRAWVVDNAALQALFSAGYAKAERTEARRLVQETVPAPSDRELLYRLDLVLGSIRDPQIDAVSSVEPRIHLPREKLADIRGLWLQDDGGAGLALSPLLSGIGIDLLPPDEISAVRTALADEIVHRKVISAADVDRALTYFASAGHWNRAALYYAIALDSYLRAPKDVPLPGFVRRWLPSPPTQIEEPLMAFVLASQIAFLDREHEDANSHTRAILEILKRQAEAAASETDCLACISAALHAGPLRGITVGAMTLRLVQLAVNFTRKLRQLGSPAAKQAGRSVFATLWISVGNVKTPADLREWSALIDYLTDREIDQSNPNADIAQQGMRLMPQAAVKVEGRRTTPRWVALDAALQQLEATGIEKRIYGLAVGAAAARILAKGGYQNDIDGAVVVAEKLLEKQLEPAHEFVIREGLGHQLLRAKRNKAAVEQFDRALALDVKSQPIDLLRVHGALSVLLRESNHDKSIEHAKEALNLARNDPVPHSELVRALAEYALTFVDIRHSFPIWNEAIALALSEAPQHDEERGLYAVLGYVTGYLMGMAMTGGPPIGDGGRPMHAPIPGMFLQEKAPAASYFNPALMAGHMEAIANLLGHQDQATQWAERAAEFVEAGADARTRALLVRTIAPFWIRKDGFATAIHNAAQSISAIAEPGERTLDGERYARQIALFPSILRAGTLRIQLEPTATSAAREIVNACREREAIGGDGHWELAAQLVEAALVGDRSPLGTLTARAKTSDDEALKWLGHLMGMYIMHADLADALKSQAVALHASATRGQELPALSRYITFPFLHSFWARALEREPYQFSLRFKTALEKAARLGGAPGVRALISSLLLEFPRMQALPELKAWLTSE